MSAVACSNAFRSMPVVFVRLKVVGPVVSRIHLHERTSGMDVEI